MDNPVAIGIRKIMLRKGMYQKVTAERAKFTEQQFSDMLNGRKIIRAEYLPRIAKALEVDVMDIYIAGKDSA